MVVVSARGARVNRKDGAMKTSLHPSNGEPSATTHAILAADKTYTREELHDRLWERRGLLKRLVRSDEVR
jgi:hypothetical protein